MGRRVRKIQAQSRIQDVEFPHESRRVQADLLDGMDPSTMGQSCGCDLSASDSVLCSKEASEPKYGLETGRNLRLDRLSGRTGLVDGEEWIER